MRLAAALLALALGASLGGSIASADDAAPPPPPAKPTVKVPLRVVRVMPESHQALLFDRDRNTHVLVELGTAVDGFSVQDIADDTVTLIADGTQVVLAAPEHRHHDDAPAPAAQAAPVAPKAAPIDPYAEPAGGSIAAPVDPYGEPVASAPVRVVEAPKPIEAGDGGVRTVDAQAPAPAPTPVAVPIPAVSAIPAAPTPAPAAVPAPPAPTAPTTPTAVVDLVADPVLVLSRPELATALSDFGKLAAGIHAAFTPGGVRVDGVVADSLFARAGLRAGDVISAVNGQPLRTLDDAAELYAQASTAQNLTVTVVRGGKPASLHVTIK